MTVACSVQYAFVNKWAMTCDFQQCGILTWIDSYEPVQPPFKLRNSKWCLVSSFTVICVEYLNEKQRLWSDCAYAQADLSLCWSHIPCFFEISCFGSNDNHLSMSKSYSNFKVDSWFNVPPIDCWDSVFGLCFVMFCYALLFGLSRFAIIWTRER